MRNGSSGSFLPQSDVVDELLREARRVIERLGDAVNLGRVELVERKLIKEHGLEGRALIQVGSERRDVALVQFRDDGLLQARCDLWTRAGKGNSERDLA